MRRFEVVRAAAKALLLPAVVAAWMSACTGSDRSAHFVGYGPFLDSLRLETGVPGLAFAAFDDSGLLYEHLSGVKDRSSGTPLGGETAFEAASISKALFAYLVVSLAREGTLDLDASLETLVPAVPELAYDDRSGQLTPRLLLSHQGGLPNWRSRMDFTATSYSRMFPPGDTLRFSTDPGAGFRYSGEGYLLLQRIVEERTGSGLNELVRQRIFEPLGMTRSSFVFDELMRSDYSLGHDAAGNPDKWELALALASSTLHTTASDLAIFGAHMADQLQSDGPYAELGDPSVVIEKVDGVERSWGPGLGVVTEGTRRYVYHTGNNVIFIADFLYGVEENLGYVLLTNSAEGKQIADALESRFLGRRIRR